MNDERQSPGPLARAGIMKLFGSVVTERVEPIIDTILEANLTGRRDPLRLWVDSPGGSVDQGFALLDIMRWSQVPIATCGLGMVGSMGLLIVMAGAAGQRTLMPHTSILSHRFSGASMGSHADLVAERYRQDLLHQRIVAHYQRCTGLPAARIEAELLCPYDRWLAPEEAVACGLADRVWQPGDNESSGAAPGGTQ
ncbi:MAG: ATP-dependent Clp protease proteolytic subunit [Planctomycetota bacterium]|nr:MAG: ATP-dependent Clp protease proteolytic subunit [Planctomycetota bacterium]